MDSSKKLYILIGFLVLVVLVLILVVVFGGKKSPQGEEKEVISLCPKEITYQGVDYKVVEINGKCWLAENLRTTSYRDGTAIANLTDSNEWAEDEQGVYVCYYNLPQSCQDYGALYNWYAVNNEKGLCPEGWSVPTDEQWTETENYEFKAVYGGFRNAGGPFDYLDEKGFFWTATPSGDFAFARVMEKDNEGIRKIESSKSSGFSVRCVMNK